MEVCGLIGFVMIFLMVMLAVKGAKKATTFVRGAPTPAFVGERRTESAAGRRDAHEQLTLPGMIDVTPVNVERVQVPPIHPQKSLKQAAVESAARAAVESLAKVVFASLRRK